MWHETIMTIDSIKRPSMALKNQNKEKKEELPVLQILRAIKNRAQSFFGNPLVISYVPCKPADPSSVCFYYISEVVSRRFLLVNTKNDRMLFSATPSCHDEAHNGVPIKSLSCHTFDQRISNIIKEELVHYVSLHKAKVYLGHLIFSPEALP